jgi:SAM-dependent methyltransferase
MSTTAKYEPQADRWTEEAYADPYGYLARRAEIVVDLGPSLEPGDTVLDLACGDGGFAEHLLRRGLLYVGVDASEAMVEAARRRLGERAELHQADLNDFRPTRPVAATTCFRAVYYARDRAAFFRQVACFTEKKLVFDLNPRQYRLNEVQSELRAAGFDRIELHPFFVPQRVASRPLSAVLAALEGIGPLARLALRFRFSYLMAAARS